MEGRILVAYATKYGATAGIGEKIAEVIREAGLPTDVVPVGRVKDLSPYRAVVLGSAVYMGRWRKEAVRFLQANERALADRPVWLFSSGPLGEGDPVDLLEGWRFPAAEQPIVERLRPRDIAVFHGVLDPHKLGRMEAWIMKKFESPMGDFRDWEAITSWAEAIAERLKVEST